MTRTIAFAIDAAIINVAGLVVAAMVTLVLSLFHISHDVRDVLVAIGGALFVLWTIAYFATFWTATGETPGNRAMAIHVVRVDGSRLRPRHGLLRIAGMIAGLPLLWGYTGILVGDRKRGFHDVLARTAVLARTVEDDSGPLRRPAPRRAGPRQ